jgi:hypothetical protein
MNFIYISNETNIGGLSRVIIKLGTLYQLAKPATQTQALAEKALY